MNTPSQQKHLDKLHAVAEEIKLEAQGRICGDCIYYRGTFCARDWDDADVIPEVIIYIRKAVACRFWKRS